MKRLTLLDGMTMTSLEISDMVDTRHDTVKRSITRLANSGVIVRPPVAVVNIIDKMGRPRETEVFVFKQAVGRRDSIVVAAQLSPLFTAAIVDRWQELELAHQAKEAPQFAVPTSFAEALRLAADQQDKINALEEQAVIDAPKVEFADKVAAAHGAMSVRQAAKILDTGQNRLFQLLRQRKWLTRRNEPYQARIEAGLLDVKLNKFTDAEGNIRNSITTLVTGKGLRAIAKILGEEK